MKTPPFAEHNQNLARRFGGLDRLHGQGFSQFLNRHAHVMVVGVGGVGSWAVEALARSGVGEITLVDLDHVSESNINRQIQATDATLGIEKIRALADRVHSYFPGCTLHCKDVFLDESNALPLIQQLSLQAQVDDKKVVLLDCCDQVKAKVQMASISSRQHIAFVTAGSAGGKSQPWLLQVADLKDAVNDPLLAKMRYQLRRHHSLSKDPKKKMGVACVYSTEQVKKSTDAFAPAGLNCAGYGSVVTVTAVMGMQMAAWALLQLEKTWKAAQSV